MGFYPCFCGSHLCVFPAVLCFLLESQVHYSFCWTQVLELLDFSLFEASKFNEQLLIWNKFDCLFLFLTTLLYCLKDMFYFQSYFLAWDCAFFCSQLFWLYLTILTIKFISPKSADKIWLKVLWNKRKRSPNSGNIPHQLAYLISNQ